jgi:hypothetical protein
MTPRSAPQSLFFVRATEHQTGGGLRVPYMLMRTTLMLRETVRLIGGAAHLFSACGRNDNWKSIFFFFFHFTSSFDS